jgi:predicted ribosome quality control (RQC) complex YloA/Tae2 family protein
MPESPVMGEGEISLMGPFSSGIAAGRYIGEQLLETACTMIVDRRIRPIRKRISAKSKLRTRLLAQLQEAQKFEQLRRETEALAAYQTRVLPGAASAQIPNPYKEGETLTLKLDPSSPLKTQIKKRFQKAAKLERSVSKVTLRLDNIDREIQLLEGIIESSTGARSFSEAIQYIDRTLQDLGVSHPQGKSAPGREKGKTYRRYDIDNDWFVLVGRSNSENDFITFQLAAPNDWWFHAQSVPGSHVVLKSKGTGENPPDRVLLAAARIAAYYSKARHASLVPVIYTRRKYVRKPRKALPGKVICEREKTLFAEPELPQSQASSGSE